MTNYTNIDRFFDMPVPQHIQDIVNNEMKVLDTVYGFVNWLATNNWKPSTKKQATEWDEKEYWYWTNGTEELIIYQLFTNYCDE